MRKFIPSLVIALSLLFTFAVGASAHTTQTATIHRPLYANGASPNATGGGCSSKATNRQGDISVSACISYSYPYLLSDSYVTFRPLSGHGGVSSCTITINTWRKNGGLVDQLTLNCAVAAATGETNAHFGPASVFATATGYSYYSVAVVKITYSDGTYTSMASPNSPVVTL